jgi:hypothetical protein
MADVRTRRTSGATPGTTAQPREIPAAPATPHSAALSPSRDSAPQTSQGTMGSPEWRRSERDQGRRDAEDLADRLPIGSFESLVAANFDLRRWPGPWRDRWRDATSEPTDETNAPQWLPMVAGYLGRHAAPDEAVEGHFEPSAPYLVGFAHQLRESWRSAVGRGLVPGDSTALEPVPKPAW